MSSLTFFFCPVLHKFWFRWKWWWFFFYIVKLVLLCFRKTLYSSSLSSWCLQRVWRINISWSWAEVSRCGFLCSCWSSSFTRHLFFCRLESAEEQKVPGFCERAEHSHKEQADNPGSAASVRVHNRKEPNKCWRGDLFSKSCHFSVGRALLPAVKGENVPVETSTMQQDVPRLFFKIVWWHLASKFQIQEISWEIFKQSGWSSDMICGSLTVAFEANSNLSDTVLSESFVPNVQRFLQFLCSLLMCPQWDLDALLHLRS